MRQISRVSSHPTNLRRLNIRNNNNTSPKISNYVRSAKVSRILHKLPPKTLRLPKQIGKDLILRAHKAVEAPQDNHR